MLNLGKFQKGAVILLAVAVLATCSFGFNNDSVYSYGEPPAVIGSSDNGDGTYTNPDIWADVPDLDIIRVGDAYWMSSTTMHMAPGVPIMKSYDLVNWETVSYCYQVMEDTNAAKLNGSQMYSNGTWASSLRYKNGTFYLVVPSNTTRKTYIYQTTDPENVPWKKYEINQQFHDCGLLLDDDGRNWLVYGASTLNIVELNADVTGLAEGATPQVLIQNLHAPDPATGVTPTSGLAEGAHIQKINGKYYVFAITWPSGKPRTEVAHRADSLMGPYEAKTIAQENVVVADGTATGGPAQGGIIDDENGDWWGFVFRDSGAVGRIPWVVPITWTDGWPMFGKDGSHTNLQRTGQKPVQGKAMKSVVASDEFDNTAAKPKYYDASIAPEPNPDYSLGAEYAYNGSNLDLAWQWNHNPDNRYWSLTDRAGWLRLTTSHTTSNFLYARNTLTQRTFGPQSAATIKLDVSNMKDGDEAGISLFTAKYGRIGVKMENGQKYIATTLANGWSSGHATDVGVESARIALSGDTVYLKAEGNFKGQADKGYFFYSLDGSTWTRLGGVLSMIYSTGNHFMGYRYALYNYAKTTTGGYADFDYYHIDDEIIGSVLPPNTSGGLDPILKLSFDDEDAGLKFQDVTATKKTDSGGTGATISSDAHLGNSLSLTTAGRTWLDVKKNDGSSLLTGLTEMTVAYWSKTPASGSGFNIWSTFMAPDSSVPSSNPTYIGLRDSGTYTVERFNSGRTQSVTGSAPSSEWKHVAVVLRPGSTSLYINGALVSSGNVNASLPTILDWNSILYIGKATWGTGEYFNGSIDEFAIYPSALTKNQVNSQMNGEPIEEDFEIATSEMQRLFDTLSLGSVIPDGAVLTGGKLALPDTHESATLTWTSDNTDIIANNGTVAMPDTETTVKLSVVIENAGERAKKDFYVRVIPESGHPAYFAESFSIPYTLSDGDTLPIRFGGHTVTWTGTPFISATGKVAAIFADQVAEVTATLGGSNTQKAFKVNILERDSVKFASYTRKPLAAVTYAGKVSYSMHLAYNSSGSDYAALNGNYGILYAEATHAENGTAHAAQAKNLKNPYVFALKGGGYGIIAVRTNSSNEGFANMADSESKGKALLFTTNDFIYYKEIGLVDLKQDADVSDIMCEYDAARDQYVIGWNDDKGHFYRNTTPDIKALGSASAAEPGSVLSYPTANIGATGADARNVFNVPANVASHAVTKLSQIVNTGASVPASIEAEDAADVAGVKATLTYSDGSTKQNKVNWDLSTVNFSQPGTYSVSGQVKQFQSMQTTTNPLAAGRADPNIFYKDGYYYFIATNESGQNTFGIRKAETIQGLATAPETQILNTSTYSDIRTRLWAPEIHEVGGSIYIFFASDPQTGQFNPQCRVMKLRDGGDMTKAADWEQPIRVKGKDGTSNLSDLVIGGITLDMTTFNVNGTQYLMWSQSAGNSWIYLATVDESQPWVLTSDPLLIAKPDYGWDNNDNSYVDEGPYAIITDEKVFITFSGSSTGTPYVVGLLEVGKDKNLMDADNWIKWNFPVLTPFSVEGELGPGHNSYCTDEDGNLIFVYHARPNGGSRTAGVRVVNFDADGDPVFYMTSAQEVKPEFRNVSSQVVVTRVPVSVTGVKLNRSSLSLLVGGEYTLTATVEPSDADNRNVTWQSDNLAIASVDQDGKVTANSAGTTTISAITADGGFVAKCKVTVSAEPVDKSELELWIGIAEEDLEENADKYIPAAIANMESVIEDAKELLADDYATQDAVDEMVYNLVLAMNQLYEKGDKAALQALVDSVDSLIESEYTADSWSDLEAALDKANRVLANENAIQDYVEAAFDELREAIESLVRRINFTGLDRAMALAQTVLANSDDYIPSTLTGLTAAYGDAETVRASTSATQAEVDAAARALLTAISKVRLKPDMSPIVGAMARATTLNLDQFESKGAKSLSALMTKAEALMDEPAKDVSQSEINALASDIDSAIKALVPKQDKTVQPSEPAVQENAGIDRSKSAVSDSLKPSPANSGSKAKASEGKAKAPDSKAATGAAASASPAASSAAAAAAAATVDGGNIATVAALDSGAMDIGMSEMPGTAVVVDKAAPASADSDAGRPAASAIIAILLLAAVGALAGFVMARRRMSGKKE
jgi:beta-xylosidase